MKPALAVIALTLAVGGTAHADERRGAVAVSSPLSWVGGSAFGLSAYGAVTTHEVLRANFAMKSNGAFNGVADVIADGDGDDAVRSGGTKDLSLGWQYYPDGAFHGFTLELGALWRIRDQRTENDFAADYLVEQQTTTFAARGLVGYSWLVRDHFFIQLAVGGSAGHESGTESRGHSEDSMPVTTDVSKSVVAAEGLLRIGGAFDLK